MAQTVVVPKRPDPCTLSNIDQILTTHTTANLVIDFAKKQLKGSISLDLKAISACEKIVLDTSYLHVQGVEINGTKAKWELKSRSEPYGSPLHIHAGKEIGSGQTVHVKVDVETTKDCTALQWLAPEQTSNRKHPYMFSQCQAIHARSIFPCQDTPSVKSTFSFNIRSSLPVFASGLPVDSGDSTSGKDGTKLYRFEQKVPIPSYLFALASGDIATAPIGPRSVVATGPGELEAAKWELEEDMERFLQAAEGILQRNPYAWGTYNVLVLPPSFPYGGMENPIFTFATPTIISGDRENIDVIAHELAHSWSGNLVSNASWEHFWLNEGWTVYLERRIAAAIHSPAHFHFSAIIGWKALSDSITQFGVSHPFTALVVDLKGKDPDDAFSSVPYEKGFTFLYHLDTLLGRDRWDAFIPHYFESFARKSLDSFEFKECVLQFFAHDADASKKLGELDWNTWFYAPGFPPKPDFDTSLVDACYALADRWERLSKGDETGFEPNHDDIASWSANQLVVFLERVQDFEQALSAKDSHLMGTAYRLEKSQNVEVSSRYFRIGLRARDPEVYEPTAELLGRVGRMKFVRPLYRGLAAADKELALKTFEKNEGFYHPICRAMVKQDLYGKK